MCEDLTIVKQELAEKIKKRINDGYYERKIGMGEGEYPPLALMSWDDRNRYREYIFGIIDEVCKEVEV